MDPNDKLNLLKMIDANNVEDCTDDIRLKKHSQKLKHEVDNMLKIKSNYSRLSKTNPDLFEKKLISECSFLFSNYTDIFNKIRKDELDVSILYKFIGILKLIEDKKLDQHTGAYEIGKLLKSLYIDSALRKSNKLDMSLGDEDIAKAAKERNKKNISWSQYKIMEK